MKRWFMLLFLELLVENYMITLIPMIDKYKYNYIPLQDNIKPLIQNFMVGVKDFNDMYILFCFIFFWFYLYYNNHLYLSIYRFTKSLFICRMIRLIGFSLTILPNPKHNCFSERFYPNTISINEQYHNIEWTEIFNARPGIGGCNDLIISGHTITYVLMCLEVYDYFKYGFIVYIPLIYKFLIIIHESRHYSVDVFLGVVISKLIWDRK